MQTENRALKKQWKVEKISCFPLLFMIKYECCEKEMVLCYEVY